MTYTTHLIVLFIFIILPFRLNKIFKKELPLFISSLIGALIGWFLLIVSFRLYSISSYDEIQNHILGVFLNKITIYKMLTEAFFVYPVGFFFSFLYVYSINFFRFQLSKNRQSKEDK